jgi:hypothetical protein
MRYLLLDSNVLAGYYLPRSLNSVRACERIQIIFDAVRSGSIDDFLYAPNFCIAEVFSVFMKYTFGAWQKKGKTLDTRIYNSLVKQFQNDIHNGQLIYHYELSRYHILGINLVAPLDHYYKISKKYKAKPMGTFDHLIISMGIHLAHIHQSENVVIVSADRRLTDILTKCKSDISSSTIRKLKLGSAKELTGKPFSPRIFPQHLNLAHCKLQELKDVFGEWPLSIKKHKKAYRYLK